MAVLSLFCTMALHAQKVTVSEEVTLRNDLSYDLVGKIDSHFVLFRDRGNKYEARIYDQDLKFKVEQEIVLADKNCALLSSLPTPTSFLYFMDSDIAASTTSRQISLIRIVASSVRIPSKYLKTYYSTPL